MPQIELNEAEVDATGRLENEQTIYNWVFQVVIHVLIHPGSKPLQSPSDDASATSKTPTDYIVVSNASVSRWACPFTRVVQLKPSDRLSTTFDLVASVEKTPTPFEITATDGIVYVVDAQLLAAQPDNLIVLEVMWRTGSSDAAGPAAAGTALVFVQLEDESSDGAAAPCRDDVLCAEFRTEDECRNGVGAAATQPGRGCSWRRGGGGGAATRAAYSDRYPTCSTDLVTCPDGFCDALESEFWPVCPQDCAGDRFWLV